ncbi:MAG: amidohydrolase [Acidobacteriota bacterium]
MERLYRLAPNGVGLLPLAGDGGLGLWEVARAAGAPAAVLLPPLWDHHGHVVPLGRSFDEADLRRCPSPEAAAEEARRVAAPRPAGAWVQGFGWDQNLWGGRFPHRRLLDQVLPGRPVLLWRIDGHAAWASTEALRRAGLLEGLSDPPGGAIQREEGLPTGILLDAAAEAVRAAVPPPSLEDLERWILQGLHTLAARGLSGVTDMGLEPREAEVFQRLDDEGYLPLAVRGFLRVSPGDPLPEAPPNEGHLFRIEGFKFFADGALGSRGAALHEDYADAPGCRGLLLWETEALREGLRWAAARGARVAVHAIGDRALRQVLDAALPLHLGSALRIEHVQVAGEEEVALLAASGATASIQPCHRLSDEGWAPLRLGERRAHAYRVASLARAGIPLLFGTDFPIEEADPLRTLAAAVLHREGEALPLFRALMAMAPPPGAPCRRPALLLLDRVPSPGDPRWLLGGRTAPLPDPVP